MVESNLSKLKGLKGIPIVYDGSEWSPLVGKDLEQMVKFIPLMGKMKEIFQGDYAPTEDDVKELVSVSTSFRTLIENVMKRTYTFDRMFIDGEFDDNQSRKDSLLEYNQTIADIGLKHVIGLGMAIFEQIPELLEDLPLLKEGEEDNEGEEEPGEDPRKGTL